MPKSRKLRPSSTPGRTKGSNCHKTVAKNFVTLDTKGYKKDWALWLQGCKEISDISAKRGGAAVSEIKALQNKQYG